MTKTQYEYLNAVFTSFPEWLEENSFPNFLAGYEKKAVKGFLCWMSRNGEISREEDYYSVTYHLTLKGWEAYKAFEA